MIFNVIDDAIEKISMLVNSSNFTSIFLKAACHGNLGEERKWSGSIPHISRHIFRRFSNTSASKNVSL